MARDMQIGNNVLKYLTQHRNLEVSLNDMEADLGYSKQRISSTISHLRSSGKVNVSSPRKSWYVYHGSGIQKKQPVTINAKAKVIAMLEDDRILFECEGRLYVGSSLEI